MERHIDWNGHRSWCEISGEVTDDRPPLILLHGGPGLPSNYFDSLMDMSTTGRAIVRYDQLGCGNSAVEGLGTELWIMQTFVHELAEVIEAIAPSGFHLFGHSWGGWLALEYVLQHRPPALRSLVLASSCASLPAFGAVTRGLKAQLPTDVQETIDRHETAGTTDSEEYFAAFMEYARRWLIRGDIPDSLMASVGGQNDEIYSIMQGPEWNVTGNLKDWDVVDRLGEITVPVLVTSGRHDEMTAELIEPLVAGLADARWVVFDDSAHMAFLEEPEAYRGVLVDFLDDADHRAAARSGL
jgi:L-proline amide hydrolase